MNKTWIHALLFGALVLGGSLTSCKKNTDITPYQNQINQARGELRTLQADHDKCLKELEDAKKQVETLKAEKTKLTEDGKKLDEALKAAKNEQEETAAKLLKAQNDLKLEKNEHESAIARANEAEKSVKELTARIKVLEEEKALIEEGKQKEVDAHNATKVTLESVQKELATAKDELTKTKAEVVKLTKEKADAEAKLVEVTKKLEAANAELGKVKDAIAKLKESLKLQAAEAKSTISVFEKQLTGLEVEAKAKAGVYNAQKKVLDGLQAQINKFKEQEAEKTSKDVAPLKKQLTDIEAQLNDITNTIADAGREAVIAATERNIAQKHLQTALDIQKVNLEHINKAILEAKAAQEQIKSLEEDVKKAEAANDAERIRAAKTALEAYRPLAEKTIKLAEEAKVEAAADSRRVDAAKMELAQKEHEAHQSAARVKSLRYQHADKIAQLNKQITAKKAEIAAKNKELNDIISKRQAVEAKAKDAETALAVAKTEKDGADKNLKELQDAIAKLKKVVATLEELAK